MKISINQWNGHKVEDLELEVVERKGFGHPDTLTDAIVEAVSRNLSKFYIEKFGKVLHHNVDKALLIGGKSQPVYGGGKVEIPITFYLVGRATLEAEGIEVPIREIYEKSAKDYFSRVRHLDPEKHVKFEMQVRPGSPDLVDLYLRSKGIPLSNDTSFGVSFCPLSSTEKVTLYLERHLNSKEFKEKYPWVGEDIKVMAIRHGHSLDLTIAVAMVSKYFQGPQEYFEAKEVIKREAENFVKENFEFQNVEIKVNSADTEASQYITVTGTSAEGGDDGQVGRGNRVNGLITPLRPMSLEAATGKNPISHVGKLYNVLAFQIAKETVEKIPEVEEAYCLIVSEIGKPITEPQTIQVWTNLRKGKISTIKPEVEKIVRRYLDELPELYLKILQEEITLY